MNLLTYCTQKHPRSRLTASTLMQVDLDSTWACQGAKINQLKSMIAELKQ